MTACGGGTSVPTTSSEEVIRLSEPALFANIKQGTSSTISLQATLLNPGIFAGAKNYYVYVADKNKVLASNVNVTPLSPTLFSLTFLTANTAQTGTYRGNFEIHLCKDAACTSECATPIPLPYDFTVTDAPLTATIDISQQLSMRSNSTTPIQAKVSVNSKNSEWSASSDAFWLQLSNAKGSGSGKFSVTISPSGLTLGSHTGKITITSSDGQTVPISLTLTVTQQQFVITGGTPTFNAINGEVIAPQVLSFDLESKIAGTWTANISAPWLLPSALSGQTPGSITLLPDPSIGKLSSGKYTSVLNLKSTGAADKSININLNLSQPVLASAQNYLNLGGANGRDWGSHTLKFNLNTGSKQWPWIINSIPSWLSVDRNSGVVNADGTTINLQADLKKLPAGLNSVAVNISATVNGDTVSLPLTVNTRVDQRKLLASEWGVALSSTPLGQVLTRTIKVTDNYGETIDWRAISDSKWLTVTPSGLTSGTGLTLSANPNALADGLNYATITISTTQPGIQAATIKVGIWKSSTVAAPQADAQQALALYTFVTADKIRPYIYANNRGNTIDVFNAYTATKVATISTKYTLGAMTVAPDGSRLFAIGVSQDVVVIDLSTMSYQKKWTDIFYELDDIPLQVIRPNNVELLLVGNGLAYVEGRLLKQSIHTEISGGGDNLVASADGRRVFSQERSSSASMFAYDIDYSSIFDGVMLSTRKGSTSFRPFTFIKDIATNNDGTKLYSAFYLPQSCAELNVNSPDLDTISPIVPTPQGYYPNNVEVTNDGRIICGFTLDSLYVKHSILWVSSPNRTVQKSYVIPEAGLTPRQLVVTPDGMIAATLALNSTSSGKLFFIQIAP